MKLLLLTILFASALAAYAGEINKVIYGRDDRVLVGSPDMPKEYQALAEKISQATAMHVERNRLFPIQAGKAFVYKAQNLQAVAQKNMCSSERFSDVPVARGCSGFLVGPDLLVTAGHCVKSRSMCENARWIFGHRMDTAIMRPYQNRLVSNPAEQWYDIVFPASEVYGCKTVIRQVKNDDVDLDFALIQLDRPVEGRQPLEYRRQGKLANDAKLLVVGHPLGLPSMATLNGLVRDNDESYYFVGNHDTFNGNSGSPVVDMATGLVEGLLVRGEDDFKRVVFSTGNGQRSSCQQVNRCLDDECEGERAQRITIIPELAPEEATVPEVQRLSGAFDQTPARATWPDEEALDAVLGEKLDKI